MITYQASSGPQEVESLTGAIPMERGGPRSGARNRSTRSRGLQRVEPQLGLWLACVARGGPTFCQTRNTLGKCNLGRWLLRRIDNPAWIIMDISSWK